MEKCEKIVFVFGTRPEAIKMVPVIKKFMVSEIFSPLVVVTAQHREMLDQVLNIFAIRPDYDLDIMGDNQTLEDITILTLKKLSEIIKIENPRMILVQGDTTTTLVGALSGVYNKTAVGHIEAGLRTFDKFQPFPEEMNRKLTSTLADIHFAPTKSSYKNLLNEGIPKDKVFITGNTVIDTLLAVIQNKYTFKKHIDKIINKKNKKLILVTAHRRESFGQPLIDILSALKSIVTKFNNTQILFPVHPNPNIKKEVYNYLNNYPNIHLVDPMDYESFVHIMNASDIILTDSGGIQEEAPSLGKPVLVLRNKTERPEAVEAGTVKLIGTDFNKIVNETARLITDKDEYDKMARAINPYGDGKASERIYNLVADYLHE